MNINKKNPSYMDFLTDENFILWRLTGDESLSNSWNIRLEQNPDENIHFQEAIRIFDELKAKEQRLEQPDRSFLLTRIEASLTNMIRRNKRRKLIARYTTAAAVALIAVSLSIYRYTTTVTTKESQKIVTNLIVGHEETDRDILLTTASGTSAFNNDLQIQVDQQGHLIVNDSLQMPKSETINTLFVPYGKHSTVTLADGTKLWINAGSTLKFPSGFQGNTREITLQGELFADVAKNPTKPFIIHAKGMDVQVYGTQLDISAYENENNFVVLVKGSAGVKHSNQAEVRLLPNEKIEYSSRTVEKSVVDVTRYTSWKDGYLVFDDTPFAEVLKEIGKYYNLSFEISESNRLKAITCTGRIYLSLDVNNVMRTISLLSSTEYKRIGKTVYLNLEQ